MDHQDVRINSKLVDKNYKTSVAKFRQQDAITFPSEMLRSLSLNIMQACALRNIFHVKMNQKLY